MNKNLINKIITYYNEDNLTKISKKLIDAYKSKQYSFLIGIGNLIDDSLVQNSKNIQKLFSQLIMLYHPDRINTHINEINKISNNTSKLEKYMHIIAVTENLNNIISSDLPSHEEYDIEYEYGYDEEDFDSVINESDFEINNELSYDNHSEIDFISLMRYRELGNVEDVLPSFYFEEIEGELYLSNSNLSDLKGLEKCSNIEFLDVSNNRIMDITQLGFLNQIKEINLSGNLIQDIEVLQNLKNVKKIDLSFNEIEEISPLLKLQNLEYLNVISNNISDKEIQLFKNKNFIFLY